MGIPLDKTFVRTYDQVNNVGEVALGDSLDALLEIQISATRGVKESVIELDGDVVRYRNGPQYWKALSWPKENVNSGIKVNVITYDGKTISVANIPGRMSLIRLLADPRATRIDATTVRIDIPVPEIGGEKLSFQLRMVQGMNPFVLTQLRGLKLPAKVTS